MALGGVYMTDVDGNIGIVRTSFVSEQVCGLVFDISEQTNFWSGDAATTQAPNGSTRAANWQNKIIELNNIDDAESLGLSMNGDSLNSDLLFGIPYYHVKHYFSIVGGSGRLFVAFADCSSNWDIIKQMQQAAQGMISQFGVWTEKRLWTNGGSDVYETNLISGLNDVGKALANEFYAPASILLCANTSRVNGASDYVPAWIKEGTTIYDGEGNSVSADNLTSGTTYYTDAEHTTEAVEGADYGLATGNQTPSDENIVLSKIPTVVPEGSTNRYVSVMLGQGSETVVAKMQGKLSTTAVIGSLGAALGCLSRAKVSECIGWVQNNNLVDYFPDVEFGFGNYTLSDGAMTNRTVYSSLVQTQLDALEEKGYMFLMKHPGYEGVYFSGDPTCTDGDYRFISRNRVINKSRRAVRAALLPYVNSPVKVDPTTGYLSAAQITVFKNLVNDALTAMKTAEEISDVGDVQIPVEQDILRNDTLHIYYTIIPMGTAKRILVTEGLTITR